MKRSRYPTLADIWRVLATSPTEDKSVEALAGLLPSRAVVFKAIDAMQDAGKDARALERYASGLGWDPLNRHCGPRPVKTGERRIYQVQEAPKTGQTFIRLPVGTLGLQKGQHADVIFEDGEIKVRVYKKRRGLTLTA